MAPKNMMASGELSPGLSIIHGNRMEALRDVAVAWIREHGLAPLEDEIFIVQSNAMAQWLKLALAGDDGCGISAGVDFQLPGRFLWKAYAAVLGNEVPDESPLDRERLIWRIMALLSDLATEAPFAPLARFLTHDADPRRGYQLSAHLADLMDQYQVYRADWLEDWARGSDRLTTARGRKAPLPPEQAWQPELWRRILKTLPGRGKNTGRSALHRRFLTRLQAVSSRPPELPRRLMVCGLSSMPQQSLEAFHALSRFCQVLIFVLNPCRHYWGDIVEDRELFSVRQDRHRPKERMPDDLHPEALHRHANPLLAAWGKQGRDYIGLLYGYDRPQDYQNRFGQIDLFDDAVPQTGAATLLQQVQQAILDLDPLPQDRETGRRRLSPKDRSIVFHLSHGRQREIEILHDQLLACFQEIPDLKPRDIIVMAPDIDAYASHIEAVFGNLPPGEPRHIPFTIADRPDRASLALLGGLETLLSLPEARVTVSDLLDLLQIEAFREAFGMSQSDIPRLQGWIEAAGIRWGIDARHREGFGLPPGLGANTWKFGIDRMLLGYAAGPSPPWQGIEPLDEVGGLEADLAGRLAAMVEALEKHRKSLCIPVEPRRWCQRIRTLANDFFAPVNSRDRLTRSRLDEALDAWEEACGQGGFTGSLPLAVIRDHLLQVLARASISQRFLAGMVNFCTLMPMRAIPFKVVCLLGMNDGEFPRIHPPFDFDLMAGPGMYRPGDRSRREDDRYMFLEALLSARERLLVSYADRNIRDNTQRSPSVLVAQFRDYLAKGWEMAAPGVEAGRAARNVPETLTVRHPLQPFARAYFEPQRPPPLFTFDEKWRDAHCASAVATEGHSRLDPPVVEGAVTVDMVTGLLKNPSRFFFNRRLNTHFDDMRSPGLDDEPFVLDGLSPFSLGKRLLAAGLRAGTQRAPAAIEEESRRLEASGALPMGGFGPLAARDLAAPVLAILKGHEELAALWPIHGESVEISVRFSEDSGGVPALEDWLHGLRQEKEGDGRPVCRWEFYPLPVLAPGGGRMTRRHILIGLWVPHLAGCAMGLGLSSFLVAPDARVGFDPMEPADAKRSLETLVGACLDGLCRPLPVTARTAAAFLGALSRGREDESDEQILWRAREAAQKAYDGDGFHSPGEKGHCPYSKRSFPDFDALWQAEENRFQRLAHDLYHPMISRIKME